MMMMIIIVFVVAVAGSGGGVDGGSGPHGSALLTSMLCIIPPPLSLFCPSRIPSTLIQRLLSALPSCVLLENQSLTACLLFAVCKCSIIHLFYMQFSSSIYCRFFFFFFFPPPPPFENVNCSLALESEVWTPPLPVSGEKSLIRSPETKSATKTLRGSVEEK